MPFTHRLAHTLRRAALAAAAAVLVIAPVRADAQGACAAGTLATYLSAGFSCRIGDWLFSQFISDAGVETHDGAEALAADAASATLTPFLSTDAQGRVTFGFDFAGLHAAAGSHGTTTGSESSYAGSSLGFWVTGLTTSARLAGARLDGSFDGFNATPDILGTVSGVGATVDTFGPASCLDQQVHDDVGPTVSLAGTCAAPHPDFAIANVFAYAYADRLFDEGNPDALRPVDGFSMATLNRFELTQAPDVTATPEPATVTLTAAGMLALAAALRRRRTRGV